MKRLLLVFVASFLFWNTPAKAWGNSGHRTVCEIALLNLTATSRAEVTRLLSENVRENRINARFAEFGQACTYADTVARTDGRDIEHYVNWARTLVAVTGQSCGARPRCVLSAINLDLSRLRNQSLTAAQRGMALIYLGHWVGDVHQPLHSSYGDDIGGGRITTSNLCDRGLHSAWDTCIFEREYLRNGQSDGDIHALAVAWNREITDADRRLWRRSIGWHWAAESYDQARQPWVHYCIMRERACWYSDQEQTLARDGQQRSVEITEEYVEDARPVIRRRIIRAGVRLAHLINQALDPDYRG